MKYLLLFFVCIVSETLCAVECQMLLSEKEQKEILAYRRYPPSTKLRLSVAAVKAGYSAINKKEYDRAIEEFNRAWRFNQKNIDAYWGAAIVYGTMSEQAKTVSEAKTLIEKSLRLFKLAETMLSGKIVEEENWKLDYAASLYVAGKILFKSEKTAAEKYFQEAEKIWLSLKNRRDMKKERDIKVYYRTVWHLTKLYRDWGRNDLYKKYLKLLPPQIRKTL